MADFTDAKVGDTVRVIGFFGVYELEVVRVTPTRIQTPEGSYRRSDGRAHGSAKGIRILKNGEAS